MKYLLTDGRLDANVKDEILQVQGVIDNVLHLLRVIYQHILAIKDYQLMTCKLFVSHKIPLIRYWPRKALPKFIKRCHNI